MNAKNIVEDLINDILNEISAKYIESVEEGIESTDSSKKAADKILNDNSAEILAESSQTSKVATQETENELSQNILSDEAIENVLLRYSVKSSKRLHESYILDEANLFETDRVSESDSFIDFIKSGQYHVLLTFIFIFLSMIFNQ
jgi:hypothetical protein